MRILQVMAGAAHGGAETAFVDLCLALKESGADLAVVMRPHKNREQKLAAAGITVYTLPFGGALDVVTPWRLRRIIKNFKPHIVQTWMSRAAQKTPRWQPSMGIPRYLVMARLGGYYKLSHFKSCDYFVAVTPDLRDFLLREGAPDAAVRVINNFACIEDIDVPVARAAHDTPEGAFLFLALGRLHTAKAMDTLLKALEAVPDAYLWIAGEGPDRTALEGLCHMLGLNDRVRFLGWRNDRAALFAAADACVFPSRYEPFGSVFVQAWGYKTPLVTTASDGPRQFVQDGQDALMVPIDDVPALAAAMNRVRTEPALRESLVATAYDRYQAGFTKERCVQAYLAYYRDLCAREDIAL